MNIVHRQRERPAPARPRLRGRAGRNAAFGQSALASRLGSRVRDTEGLTYQIYSRFAQTDALDGVWLVNVNVAPQNLAKALSSTLDEIAKYAREGATDAEVAVQKNFFAGNYQVGLGSNAGVAAALVTAEKFGFGPALPRRVSRAIRAVTTAAGERRDAQALLARQAARGRGRRPGQRARLRRREEARLAFPDRSMRPPTRRAVALSAPLRAGAGRARLPGRQGHGDGPRARAPLRRGAARPGGAAQRRQADALRGHPVFVAQHATATCCRGCLAKWHGIAAGRPLAAEEEAHVVAAIARWLDRAAAPP